MLPIDKLEQLSRRYTELDDLLCQQDVLSDRTKLSKLNKERSEIEPVVNEFRRYRDLEGCVVLIVGGDGENQVGYLRAGPGAQVPKMSPTSFIYVEPIGDGWFVFKTV